MRPKKRKKRMPRKIKEYLAELKQMRSAGHTSKKDHDWLRRQHGV